jgi:hypothetical protein
MAKCAQHWGSHSRLARGQHIMGWRKRRPFNSVESRVCTKYTEIQCTGTVAEPLVVIKTCCKTRRVFPTTVFHPIAIPFSVSIAPAHKRPLGCSFETPLNLATRTDWNMTPM